MEAKPVAPAAPPPVVEAKPGVYEPKNQWTEEKTVNLCRKIESSRSIEELKLYGEEAKDKRIPTADKDTMRALYSARMKQVKEAQAKGFWPDAISETVNHSPQPPQGEAGAPTQKGAQPTAEPWI